MNVHAIRNINYSDKFVNLLLRRKNFKLNYVEAYIASVTLYKFSRDSIPINAFENAASKDLIYVNLGLYPHAFTYILFSGVLSGAVQLDVIFLNKNYGSR